MWDVRENGFIQNTIIIILISGFFGLSTNIWYDWFFIVSHAKCNFPIPTWARVFNVELCVCNLLESRCPDKNRSAFLSSRRNYHTKQMQTFLHSFEINFKIENYSISKPSQCAAGRRSWHTIERRFWAVVDVDNYKMEKHRKQTHSDCKSEWEGSNEMSSELVTLAVKINRTKWSRRRRYITCRLALMHFVECWVIDFAKCLKSRLCECEKEAIEHGKQSD